MENEKRKEKGKIYKTMIEYHDYNYPHDDIH